MENKEHHFKVEDAQKYGIIKAILIYNITFWLDKNRASKKHLYDGFYWTYNSAKSFAELFPYLSQNQIQDHLKQLEALGVVKGGNYNAAKYDRTRWYTIPEIYGMKQNNIPEIRQMDLTNSSNANDETVTPIPDSNTDIKKTYLSSDQEKKPVPTSVVYEDKGFDIFWAAYPNKENKSGTYAKWMKNTNGCKDHLAEILAFIEKAKKTRRWSDPQYIMGPAVFINNKRWEDDITAYGTPQKDKGAHIKLSTKGEVYKGFIKKDKKNE